MKLICGRRCCGWKQQIHNALKNWCHYDPLFHIQKCERGLDSEHQYIKKRSKSSILILIKQHITRVHLMYFHHFSTNPNIENMYPSATSNNKKIKKKRINIVSVQCLLTLQYLSQNFYTDLIIIIVVVGNRVKRRQKLLTTPREK